MSKINPLYIVGILCVVVLWAYTKIQTTQTALLTTQTAIANIKNTGEYLKVMRQEFGQKQEQMRTIRAIMSKYGLQSPPHVLEVGPNKAILRAFNLDSSTVGQVTSRVLNASLQVRAYEVSDNNFSKTLRIEFKL